MKQIQTQHLIQVEDLTKQNFEQKEKLDDIEKWMKTKGFKTEQRDNLDNALRLEEHPGYGDDEQKSSLDFDFQYEYKL